MAPIWIVGHRGSPAEEVENTLPSFERAVRRDGANALEMDICVTSDDHLLVWHDFDGSSVEARLRQWDLEPQTKVHPRSFPGTVRDMTLREARATLGFEETRDAHLPTLDEVVEWSRSQPSLGLVFLDLKIPPHRRELVPLLLARLDRILGERQPRFTPVLETPHVAIAAEIRRLGARHPLGLDILGKDEVADVVRLSTEWACAQKCRPGQAICPAWRHLRLIRALGRRGGEGRRRCAFTLNDADEMRAVLALGIDAIQTDRPATLRDVVAGWGFDARAESSVVPLRRESPHRP